LCELLKKMVKNQSKNRSLEIRIKEKMASTWGLVLSAFSIFAVGFSTGCYISNVLAEIKYREVKIKQQQEFLDLKSQHEEKVHELSRIIYELQKENLKYGREKE
jgi:uncharacterized protein YlxW (UPF0749 family)